MRMEYGMLGLGWKEKRRVFVGGRGDLNEGGGAIMCTTCITIAQVRERFLRKTKAREKRKPDLIRDQI